MFNNSILIFLVLLSVSFQAFTQNITLRGKVEALENENKKIPLLNANVYWFGKTQGTTTDANGYFAISKPVNENFYLIASYIGYLPDTILILKSQTEINITLKPNSMLREVVIGDSKESTYISKINPIQTQIITTAGLQKLACCNLSESFENNATVDVAFTDAVSGAKQIQMLGLAGIYSQLLTENYSSIKGLATSHGLGYIPGPWMESIQISKGASSVINGYESTTGQINVEFKKPENSERLHLNFYGNEHGKAEGNLTSAYKINNNLSTMLMFHGERFSSEIDKNHDKFLDLPMTSQVSIFNRWRYEYKNKFVSQFGVKYLTEDRKGGQTGYNNPSSADTGLYGIGISANRYEAFIKFGIPLKNKPENNIGIIASTSNHKQSSFFGYNIYTGEQKSFNTNFIYQTTFISTKHKINSGMSFQYDDYNEKFIAATIDTNLKRIEKIPGIFGQYSYSLPEKFSIIAGIRTDFYNLSKIFFTPRVHLKYDINKNNILKASAGKGYRITNLLSENIGIMASSRKFMFTETLNPEEAWNYGMSFTRYFTLNKNKGTFIVDFYRTDFINQVIVDVDKKYDEVWFYNLKGISYSNSIQAEVIFEPVKGLEIDAAFRINDVRTTINGKLEQKPFVNMYKGLLAVSYATKYEKWKFDITSQYNGGSRLPDTEMLPLEYKKEKFSPPYIIIHAQVTKRFKLWNVYAGVENITDFTQSDPIVAPDAPFGNYFDTSMLWGPIVGRTIYVGFRFTMK